MLKLSLMGSRDAGFSSGIAFARASSRIFSMAGRGRDASMRSRIVFSSSATFDAARRFVASSSTARLYSKERPIELIGQLQFVRLDDVFARGVLRRALERDPELGPGRVFLHGPGEFGHRGIEVAHPLGFLSLAERAARGTTRHHHTQHDEHDQPVLQHGHSIQRDERPASSRRTVNAISDAFLAVQPNRRPAAAIQGIP